MCTHTHPFPTSSICYGCAICYNYIMFHFIEVFISFQSTLLGGFHDSYPKRSTISPLLSSSAQCSYHGKKLVLVIFFWRVNVLFYPFSSFHDQSLLFYCSFLISFCCPCLSLPFYLVLYIHFFVLEQRIV